MGTPELQNGCIVTQASILEVNMQIECCYVISIYMQQVAFNFLDEAFSFGRFFIWKPELTHFKLCLVWVTWSEVQKVFLEAASTNDGWVDSGSCLIPLRICLFFFRKRQIPRFIQNSHRPRREQTQEMWPDSPLKGQKKICFWKKFKTTRAGDE